MAMRKEDWLQAEGEVARKQRTKRRPSHNLKDHCEDSLVKPDGLDDHVVESDAQTTGVSHD